MDWSMPMNIHEVCRFMGLASIIGGLWKDFQNCESYHGIAKER
jgi:hypothetical protein